MASRRMNSNALRRFVLLELAEVPIGVNSTKEHSSESQRILLHVETVGDPAPPFLQCVRYPAFINAMYQLKICHKCLFEVAYFLCNLFVAYGKGKNPYIL